MLPQQVTLSDAQLEELFLDLESDRVERKSTVGKDKDKICQTICAFANDMPNHRLPGVIFIGVNDNGTCSNIQVDDELLKTLSAIGSDGNILPKPAMIVQKKHLAGCEVAVVIVQPSVAPPVRYEGRVWIRVGPRRATANQQEESQLVERRRYRDLPFDLHPLHSVTLDDLDLNYFQQSYLPSAVATQVLEENQRTLQQQLAALRLVTVDVIPTVLGVLTLGKDPTYPALPGAYVQFVRIDGNDLSDPIKDEKKLSGPLPQVLRLMDELLEVNITTEVDFTSDSLEIRRPDYPIEALRQFTRNAILHRTYQDTSAPTRIYWFSDRIQIQNPGGPYGVVTPENFGEPGVTDYRNPHLAEVMKNLGYVQKFGAGIQTARKALERNGNPPPEFEPVQNHVAVIVRRH